MSSQAYVTFLRDENSDTRAEAATLPLDALADQELAAWLRDGQLGMFLDGLISPVEDDEEVLRAVRVDVESSTLLSGSLRVLLGAAVGATDLSDALIRIEANKGPEEALSSFVDDILGAPVLFEQSDAAAIAAAGAVGAAVVGAEGYVLAALVTAGQIGGVAVLIATPVGLVILGVGAAYVTWRLFRHRRPKGTI